MLHCLNNTVDFKTHVHTRTQTHTRTHTHTHTDTDTHTHKLAAGSKNASSRAVGVRVPEAAFAVQCTDILQTQCKVSERMETKMYFSVNAPSRPRARTNASQGQQELPETTHRRILGHRIDFFSFMIEKSSSVHRILITHVISHTTP